MCHVENKRDDSTTNAEITMRFPAGEMNIKNKKNSIYIFKNLQCQFTKYNDWLFIISNYALKLLIDWIQVVGVFFSINMTQFLNIPNRKYSISFLILIVKTI